MDTGVAMIVKLRKYAGARLLGRCGGVSHRTGPKGSAGDRGLGGKYQKR